MSRWLILRKKSLMRDDSRERVVVDAENYSSGIRRNFLHFEPPSLSSSKALRKRRRMSEKS